MSGLELRIPTLWEPRRGVTKTTPKLEGPQEVRDKGGNSSKQSFLVVILPKWMLINQLQPRFTEWNYIFL